MSLGRLPFSCGARMSVLQCVALAASQAGGRTSRVRIRACDILFCAASGTQGRDGRKQRHFWHMFLAMEFWHSAATGLAVWADGSVGANPMAASAKPCAMTV
jgi:hypothetical protein